MQREEAHVAAGVFGLLVSTCTVLDVSGSQETPGSCPDLTDAHVLVSCCFQRLSQAPCFIFITIISDSSLQEDFTNPF